MENQLTWRDFLTEQEVADIAALNAARVGFEAEQKLARSAFETAPGLGCERLNSRLKVNFATSRNATRRNTVQCDSTQRFL